MFNALPSELILRIFVFLDVQDIHTCQLVSGAWNSFVKQNESTFYHSVAIQHNFVSDWTCSFEEAKAQNYGSWLASASNWKDLCQRFYMLDRNWHARGEHPIPRERLYKSSRGVHRFKLDEEHRLIIATFIKGGLKVFCMDTDQLLFELSREHVRNLAHCEYEKGYLIFDAADMVEVWAFDFAPLPPADAVSNAKPDERQLRAYRDAVANLPASTTRGVLRPHALIRPAAPCRAYRFVYPTLLIGSFRGQTVLLYDIPTAALEESIPFPTHPTSAGENGVLPIHYVELGPRHVFVCSKDNVLILARKHETIPEGRRVLRFPSSERSLAYTAPNIAKTRSYRMSLSYFHSTRGIGERSLSPLVQGDSTALISFRETHHNFCAVHVSPNGKSFVAVTWTGLLFLVKDFERVLPGANGSPPEKCLSEPDVTFAIDMQSPLTNMSFGTGGQIVVHSFTAFHVLLWPSSAPDAPWAYPSSRTASVQSSLPEAFSDVRIFSLGDFVERNALPLISCLKVTRTSIWLDWNARALSLRRRAESNYPNMQPASWHENSTYIWSDGENQSTHADELEEGEREADYAQLMEEDEREGPEIVVDEFPIDDDDEVWNPRRNPFGA